VISFETQDSIATKVLLLDLFAKPARNVRYVRCQGYCEMMEITRKPVPTSNSTSANPKR
jgi:hypothetical protein